MNEDLVLEFVCGAHGWQPIELSFNGVYIDHLFPEGFESQKHYLSIPSNITKVGLNSIGIHAPGAAIAGGGDPRVLAVKFESLRLQR